MSSSNCCFMTCIHISQEAGQVVWYSLLSEFSTIYCDPHSQRLWHKAEIDVFLELFCFFDDPADVGNLISGSSAFSKSSLNIWKFTVHVLLKPGLENFVHYFTRVWNEYNCVGEGNGNPLQYSRLENPRDRGAWWAAVHGVAQSGI